MKKTNHEFKMELTEYELDVMLQCAKQIQMTVEPQYYEHKAAENLVYKINTFIVPKVRDHAVQAFFFKSEIADVIKILLMMASLSVDPDLGFEFEGDMEQLKSSIEELQGQLEMIPAFLTECIIENFTDVEDNKNEIVDHPAVRNLLSALFYYVISNISSSQIYIMAFALAQTQEVILDILFDEAKEKDPNACCVKQYNLYRGYEDDVRKNVIDFVITALLVSL